MRANRFLGVILQLDTNRINSRGNLEAINQLERWAAEGIIHLSMADTAHAEAEAGGDLLRTAKSSAHWTASTFVTAADEPRLREIERILSPNGAKKQNERNDVRIVFNAGKNGHTLVTNDQGILRKADALRAVGITVMRDEEAVAMVRRRIEVDARRR